MAPATWYLLIHQLPVRPLYFRARIRRMLGDLGTLPLKKAVYALPKSPEGLERLTAIAAEIRAGGGEAFVCEARFTEEKDAAVLVETNRRERGRDYDRILGATRDLCAEARGADATRVEPKLARLRDRLERVRAIDHASPPGGAEAAAAIEDLERSSGSRAGPRSGATGTLAGYTWVTRRGLHIDRLACAWVVRRFIDPQARFRFSDPADLRCGPGEIAFDTPGGRISHEQNRCSVETLLRHAGIDDPAVRRIAEIVHDIDLKDGRYGHPETAGVEQLVAGIVQGHEADRDRLDRGLALFDDLHGSYRRAPRVLLRSDQAPRRPGRPRRSP